MEKEKQFQSEEGTSIPITKGTRTLLRNVGRKGETYDEVVRRGAELLKAERNAKVLQ